MILKKEKSNQIIDECYKIYLDYRNKREKFQKNKDKIIKKITDKVNLAFSEKNKKIIIKYFNLIFSLLNSEDSLKTKKNNPVRTQLSDSEKIEIIKYLEQNYDVSLLKNPSKKDEDDLLLLKKTDINRFYQKFSKLGFTNKNFFHSNLKYTFIFNHERLRNLPEELKESLSIYFKQLASTTKIDVFNYKLFSCSDLKIKYLSHKASKSIVPKLIESEKIILFSPLSGVDIPNFLKSLISRTNIVEQVLLEKGIKKKFRHDYVESFCLLKNPNILAIEIPVWDDSILTSGHIDFLIYGSLNKKATLFVVDYKPKVGYNYFTYFLKSIPQVSMYAFLLKKKLGFIPSIDIKCVIFNSELGWLFDPNICLNYLPSLIIKFYDRSKFLPFYNVFGDPRTFPSVYWDKLMKLESLHNKVDSFFSTFKIEIEKICEIKFETYSDISEKIWDLCENLIKYFPENRKNKRKLKLINNLQLTSTILKQIDSNSDKDKILLNFCRHFYFDSSVFSSNDIKLDSLKILYYISRLCILFSSQFTNYTNSIEGNEIKNTKDTFINFINQGFSSNHVQDLLKISHNTLNQIIRTTFYYLKVSNYSELSKMITYLNQYPDLVKKLVYKGYNFENVERNILKNCANKDFTLKETGEALKMDPRTVERKFKEYTNNTFGKFKENSFFDEKRDNLKRSYENLMLKFTPINEIKERLNIGDYKISNLSKEVFGFDLPPKEAQIFLILRNIDKNYLSTFNLSEYRPSDIRLFFIKKMLDLSLTSNQIAKKLHISRQQVTRLRKKIKDGYLRSIKKENFEQNNIKHPKREEISTILKKISDYDSDFFKKNSSKLKKLNFHALKREFIKLLCSNENSSDAARIYGLNSRHGLRHEIEKLWNKSTSYTDIKNLSINNKSIDKEKNIFQKISKLILKDYSIHKISKNLGISTWKIQKIIKTRRNGINFAKLKILLKCEKLDEEIFNLLNKKNYPFPSIVKYYILNLANKGFHISKISELLGIYSSEITSYVPELKIKINKKNIHEFIDTIPFQERVILFVIAEIQHKNLTPIKLSEFYKEYKRLCKIKNLMKPLSIRSVDKYLKDLAHYDILKILNGSYRNFELNIPTEIILDYYQKKNFENENIKSLKEIETIAKERGEYYLSKNFINSHTELEWKCGICGNVWKAKPIDIKGTKNGQGSWCPNHQEHKKILENDKENLLSNCRERSIKIKNIKDYKGKYTKILLECISCGYGKKDVWISNKKEILNKDWKGCPKCNKALKDSADVKSSKIHQDADLEIVKDFRQDKKTKENDKEKIGKETKKLDINSPKNKLVYGDKFNEINPLSNYPKHLLKFQKEKKEKDDEEFNYYDDYQFISGRVLDEMKQRAEKLQNNVKNSEVNESDHQADTTEYNENRIDNKGNLKLGIDSCINENNQFNQIDNSLSDSHISSLINNNKYNGIDHQQESRIGTHFNEAISINTSESIKTDNNEEIDQERPPDLSNPPDLDNSEDNNSDQITENIPLNNQSEQDLQDLNDPENYDRSPQNDDVDPLENQYLDNLDEDSIENPPDGDIDSQDNGDQDEVLPNEETSDNLQEQELSDEDSISDSLEQSEDEREDNPSEPESNEPEITENQNEVEKIQDESLTDGNLSDSCITNDGAISTFLVNKTDNEVEKDNLDKNNDHPKIDTGDMDLITNPDELDNYDH
ncbi:MAG: hypothetical protein EU550_01005, partial [Promethearchaeota archaeon]